MEWDHYMQKLLADDSGVMTQHHCYVATYMHMYNYVYSYIAN